MSASVASKNLYELLGNDPPEEEEVNKKPPRQVIKNTTSTRKHDEKLEAGSTQRGNQGRRGRGGYSGNEGAFRDREAGSENNRRKPAEESGSSQRGGRGRGRDRRDRQHDRHSATGKDEHEKQVAHGWGAQEGTAEWKDELAGAELAQNDAAGADPADPNAATPEDAEAAAAAEEEEAKTKTYDEYLAELAARQADLGPRTDVRRPNEGSQTDKKWAKAKEFKKEEDAAYIAGDPKDKSRNRERKVKNVLDIDQRFTESGGDRRRGSGERGDRGDRGDRGGRGGRGGGERGNRGRGEGRGGYSRGEHRGGDRGGRGGPRSGGAAPVKITDESAFPALGA